MTPSQAAGRETRSWARRLEGSPAFSQIPVRDMICIELPFYVSRSNAIDRARKKVPPRYYGRTWMIWNTDFVKALHIPAANPHAFVIVVDAQGHVVAREHGRPDGARFSRIKRAVLGMHLRPTGSSRT